MPTVSVIIPNYNHARYLPKRIETVLGQTYQDFELILLDDCSTDGSRSILSQYASDHRVRIEMNERNSGSTFKQWNKGVRLAKGKYIWIAESDDYADERLLETLIARLDRDSSVVLANCRSWRVLANGDRAELLDSHLADLDPVRWATDFTTDGREECARYLIFRNTVQSASSVVFRRDVYCEIGGADEGLIYCGDWKMWAAMALAGGKIVHVGEVLNFYRTHETTVTARANQRGLKPAETLSVVRWIVERAGPDDESRRERLCREIANLWVPAVLSGRTPTAVRKAIFRDAVAIDRRALLRFARPAMNALRLASSRRYRDLRAGLRGEAVGSVNQ